VLVDAGEENLFTIQMELLALPDTPPVIPVIARVQDEPVMRKLFEQYRPETVFHAAAYKHVPLMEMNPWQAVENNVLGSYTVMQCARDAGVKRFVLVSTDKAVRPTNVLGSSGSVVPTFRRQIERGGPVTVTHPEMTRYFMTIPEASRLILQAGALGEGGELFILHMGTPVCIADMARDLIRLSGKEPDVEIKSHLREIIPEYDAQAGPAVL